MRKKENGPNGRRRGRVVWKDKQTPSDSRESQTAQCTEHRKKRQQGKRTNFKGENFRDAGCWKRPTNYEVARLSGGANKTSADQQTSVFEYCSPHMLSGGL